LRSRSIAAKLKRPALVLLDPGHGGDQPGAKPASGLDEKELTLEVARIVSAELKRLGVSSVLTRDDDSELGLCERTSKIDEVEADLFISIHMNSAENAAARGLETYILPYEGYPSTAGGHRDTKRVVGNSSDELNAILAYLIHRDTLRATGAEDRGIKRARFEVLVNSTCPAVLVECGFLSNTNENSLLQTATYREELGKGVATGINYFMSLW
jgi:N-acetylmuramoyl-L-alanine amidase